MEINTFTLITSDHDENSVFAVGMSITHTDGEQEVVTYRRDPISGQTMFATFDSPERALARCNMLLPVRLAWHHETEPVR